MIQYVIHVSSFSLILMVKLEGGSFHDHFKVELNQKSNGCIPTLFQDFPIFQLYLIGPSFPFYVFVNHATIGKSTIPIIKNDN